MPSSRGGSGRRRRPCRGQDRPGRAAGPGAPRRRRGRSSRARNSTGAAAGASGSERATARPGRRRSRSRCSTSRPKPAASRRCARWEGPDRGPRHEGGERLRLHVPEAGEAPERVLPKEWQDSELKAVAVDQTAAAHPAATVIVGALAQAVGIPSTARASRSCRTTPRSGSSARRSRTRSGPSTSTRRRDTRASPRSSPPATCGRNGARAARGTGWTAGPSSRRACSISWWATGTVTRASGAGPRRGQAALAADPRGRRPGVHALRGQGDGRGAHGGAAVMRYTGEYPGRIEGLTANNYDVTRWMRPTSSGRSTRRSPASSWRG